MCQYIVRRSGIECSATETVDFVQFPSGQTKGYKIRYLQLPCLTSSNKEKQCEASTAYCADRQAVA